MFALGICLHFFKTDRSCDQHVLLNLGLGSSASHHLVEGIARAGNGTALFASLEERLENKVMQQLQDALQPSLSGKSKCSIIFKSLHV